MLFSFNPAKQAGVTGRSLPSPQLLLKMVLLLIGTVVQLKVIANGQTFTLNLQNVPIENAFKEIEKKTGYSFLYTKERIKDAGNVTVQANDAKIEDVLSQLFAGSPLTYTLQGKQVVVKRSDMQKKAYISELAGVPPGNLVGYVLDEAGNPLSGASVTVKDTKLSAASQSNGRFELKGIAATNIVLVISFVGYETQEFIPEIGKSIVVRLKSAEGGLDDVQVIAYGITTRRLSTGNISMIKAVDIAKQPVQNPLLALQGRVPGIEIKQNTGIPGGGITVRIQGQNSLSRGNDPLYVIDGVPYTSQSLPNIGGTGGLLGDNGNSNSFSPGGGGNPLAFINVSDIESISVLKDADATAIYGSRAANGAVLITTKKGKAGPTRVDVNVQRGEGKVTRKLPLLNTMQYLQMRREAKANDGASVLPTDYDLNGTWDTTRYTDWQKELLGGASQYTNLQLSVSGGREGTNFTLGAGYHKETTVFPGDLSDQKGGLHFNLNHTAPNQRFKIQLGGQYLLDRNRLVNSTDLVTTANWLSPNAPSLYKADGSLNWAPLSNGNSSWFNPLAYLKRRYNMNTNNLVANSTVSYQVLSGLELKASLGYTNMDIRENTLFPLASYAPEVRATTTRSAIFSNSNLSSWIIEPQAMYKKSIGKWMGDFLLGGTFQVNNSNLLRLSASGFNRDEVMEDIKSASSVTVGSTLISSYKYNAVFGRFNLSYDDRYIFNLVGRRDGSSRFGSENLFHNFGSVAAAWIFSKEEFFQQRLSFVNFGKLRTSFGTTGNDQIGDYQYLSLYSTLSPASPYQGATGLAPGAISNPYLQWERTNKLQFGLDLGFLKDRLAFSVNHYRNRSSNQLQPYALPIMAGRTFVYANIPAVIRNTGWEFVLTTLNIQRKLNWKTSVNITFQRNKLVDYPGLSTSSYANVYIIGQSINVAKLYQSIGVDPATGLFRFMNEKGDVTSGALTTAARNTLINTAPKFYGGIINSFSYKGLEIEFLFQFVKKLGVTYAFGSNPGFFSSTNNALTGSNNQPIWVMDRWQKIGDVANMQKFSSTYPTAIYTPYLNIMSSSANYADASFIRLKNVSLSYQLSSEWNRNLFKSLRVFVQGQNLLTITGLKTWDPESAGVSSLPPLKVWIAGLQLGL